MATDENDDDLDIRDRPASRRTRELSWFDQQFRNTNIVVLVLFALCCGEVALIFGILGVALCHDPTARRNATVVLSVGVVRFCLALILFAVRVAVQR